MDYLSLPRGCSLPLLWWSSCLLGYLLPPLSRSLVLHFFSPLGMVCMWMKLDGEPLLHSASVNCFSSFVFVSHLWRTRCLLWSLEFWQQVVCLCSTWGRYNIFDVCGLVVDRIAGCTNILSVHVVAHVKAQGWSEWNYCINRCLLKGTHAYCVLHDSKKWNQYIQHAHLWKMSPQTVSLLRTIAFFDLQFAASISASLFSPWLFIAI